MVDNDVSLARACQRGEKTARRMLVERLLNRVRTMVGYMVGSDQDAEDLVQASVVEILHSIHGYQGHGQLESWADRITVRTSMNMLYRRSSLKEHPLGDVQEPSRLQMEDLALAPLQGHPPPERATLRRQLRQQMALLLQRLKPERRVTVLLRWVQGYSLKEIADMTDVSVNTVRDRLQTGKRQLRALILKDPRLRDWAPERWQVRR